MNGDRWMPVDLAASITPDELPPWLAPFWLAARGHRLVVAQCENCGTCRMPPTPFCASCHSEAIVWCELDGGATVYSFTVVRHPVDAALVTSVPYVIAVVDLDGAADVRLVTNIVECEVDDIFVGMRVGVRWDDVSATVTVPRFGPELVIQ